MLLCDRFVGMERVAVATQCADAESMVREDLLEVTQRRTVIEHGEFAMRIAHIVPGCQLNRIDIERRKLFKNRFQRQLRQQRRKDPNSHSLS